VKRGRIGAVIFDCDGVLVDSEPLAAKEWASVLGAMGLPIDIDRIYREFLGRSTVTMINAAQRDYDVDLRPALPDFSVRLENAFRDALTPIPGIAEVLAELRVPHAVASSSAFERIQLSLELTGLRRFFGDHVYSSTMVKNGKPAPDLFLFAADKLGVAPADCVVIEDSPAGVTAAQAAGMRVIGFLGGSHAERARLAERLAVLEPDAVIEHASDLPNTLARMS